VRQALRSAPSLLGSRLLGVLLAAALLAMAGRGLSGQALAQLFIALAVLQITALIASVGFPALALAEHARGCPLPALLAQLRRPLWRRACLAGLLYAGTIWWLERELSLLLLAPAHLLFVFQLSATSSLVHGRGGPLALAELLSRTLSWLAGTALYVLEVRSPGAWALAFASGSLLPQALLAASAASESARSTTTARGSSVVAAQLDLSTLRKLRTIATGDLARASYLLGPHLLFRALNAPGYTSYAAPARLLGIAQLAPSALATVLLGPLGHGDETQSRRSVRRLLPWTLAAGSGAALLTAIPAEPWIALFFPELQDPVAAVRSLRILAGTLPATFVASLLLPFFLARHREALVRNISILGLLALGVALLSARAMDAQSVAFALLCCEVSVALACLLAFFGPARIRRQADD
jgi:O-antigen/teichoic acid export membrane protein